MAKKYKDLKIEENVFKNFKQAKRLKEFQLNCSLSVSEFLDHLLENEFKKFDDKIIKKES